MKIRTNIANTSTLSLRTLYEQYCNYPQYAYILSPSHTGIIINYSIHNHRQIPHYNKNRTHEQIYDKLNNSNNIMCSSKQSKKKAILGSKAQNIKQKQDSNKKNFNLFGNAVMKLQSGIRYIQSQKKSQGRNKQSGFSAKINQKNNVGSKSPLRKRNQDQNKYTKININVFQQDQSFQIAPHTNNIINSYNYSQKKSFQNLKLQPQYNSQITYRIKNSDIKTNQQKLTQEKTQNIENRLVIESKNKIAQIQQKQLQQVQILQNFQQIQSEIHQRKQGRQQNNVSQISYNNGIQFSFSKISLQPVNNKTQKNQSSIKNNKIKPQQIQIKAKQHHNQRQIQNKSIQLGLQSIDNNNKSLIQQLKYSKQQQQQPFVSSDIKKRPQKFINAQKFQQKYLEIEKLQKQYQNIINPYSYIVTSQLHKQPLVQQLLKQKDQLSTNKNKKSQINKYTDQQMCKIISSCKKAIIQQNVNNSSLEDKDGLNLSDLDIDVLLKLSIKQKEKAGCNNQPIKLGKLNGNLLLCSQVIDTQNKPTQRSPFQQQKIQSQLKTPTQKNLTLNTSFIPHYLRYPSPRSAFPPQPQYNHFSSPKIQQIKPTQSQIYQNRRISEQSDQLSINFQLSNSNC